jgi:hypothetical protein
VKVIFLDVDGVLNSETLYHTQDRQLHGHSYYWNKLDPKAVARLQRIVEATGASIVVSSSWRIIDADYEALLSLLPEFGCTAPILGRTCRYGHAIEVLGAHDGRKPDHGGNVPRGWEIETWLLENPGATSFCILDDDGDMDFLQDHLVQTSWKTGLLDEHVEKAINLLLES